MPPVAFVAGIIETHERFLDGEKGAGFFPQLEHLLGRGAFDSGGGRFALAVGEGELVRTTASKRCRSTAISIRVGELCRVPVQ